jgi:hypothetical protein
MKRCMLFLAAFFCVGAMAQFGGLERATGFKLILDFYATPSGVQKKKTVLTGAQGQLLSKDMVYLVNPRIEQFREDGTLASVATATDALLDRATYTVSGTNMISFRNAETNLFVCGQGFEWHQSNSVLTILKQSYTWIDRAALTNSPPRK